MLIEMINLLEQYNGARLFFITVEAPTDIVIGEQVGVKVAVFNYQAFEIRVSTFRETSLSRAPGHLE